MVARPRPDGDPEIADEAPSVSHLTDYDYRLLIHYLRLLDAEKAGGDWREILKVIFKVDTSANPARAKRLYDSHSARAHWMMESGYRHLLKEADDTW